MFQMRAPVRSRSRVIPVLGLWLGVLTPVLSPGSAPAQSALGAAKPYTVTVQPVTAQKGQEATAQVIIRPAKGWHINKEYPASLKLRPPAGVVAKKAELGQKDAVLSDDEGRFDVVLTGAQPGKQTVPGDLRFAVCNDSSCDPQRSQVAIELNVK